MYFCRLISSRLYWVLNIGLFKCQWINTKYSVFLYFVAFFVWCVRTSLFWQYSNDCKCRNWLMWCTKFFYCWCELIVCCVRCLCVCVFDTFQCCRKKVCTQYGTELWSTVCFVWQQQRTRNWPTECLVWLLKWRSQLWTPILSKFGQCVAAVRIEFHLAHKQDIHAPFLFT